MKACKDCRYYETYKQNEDKSGRTFMVRIHNCRLYPKVEEVDSKGCGQYEGAPVSMTELYGAP